MKIKQIPNKLGKTIGLLKIDELVSIKMVNEEDLIQLVKVSPVMPSIHATEEL